MLLIIRILGNWAVANALRQSEWRGNAGAGLPNRQLHAATVPGEAPPWGRAYFQLFIAFLWSDSGPSSDSSILTPLGALTFAIIDFVDEVRGSSTVTPRSFKVLIVARISSTSSPTWLMPGVRLGPAGCSSTKVFGLAWI